MNESAVPLVDVPEASTTASTPSRVHFEPDPSMVSVWLHADATDELDDLLDDLSERLGPDGRDALHVTFEGEGARAHIVQSLLSFITEDCDRAVHTVELKPSARDALLAQAVGRPIVCSDPEPGPALRPPPLALADTVLQSVPEATALEPAVDPEPTHPLVASEADTDPTEQATAAVEPAVDALPSGVDVILPAADPTHTAATADSEEDVDADEDDEQDHALETPLHSRPWGQSQDGDRRVLTLRRTVRSGKSVRFAGDVVVFGDVNAGAQVVADGDIVVLGRLRGLAHAGQRGDNDAIVVGLDMQSGQVRIGDTIAFPRPAESRAGTSRLAALLRRPPTTPNRSVSPSVARVVDGEIRIEDYRGRLHS